MKYKKNKIKHWVGSIFAYGLLLLGLGGFLAVIVFFGGAIMTLFGFSYKSYTSIFIYFFISGVICLPLDIIALSFPKVLAELGMIQHSTRKIVHVALDTIFNSIIFSIVDFFMDSIYTTDMAIVVVSFIMAIVNVYLENKATKW